MGFWNRQNKRKKNHSTFEEYILDELRFERYKRYAWTINFVVISGFLMWIAFNFVDYSRVVEFSYGSFVSVTPAVKHAAASAVSHCSLIDNYCKTRGVLEYIVSNVHYSTEYFESIQTPDFTLEAGYGDCEDFSILAVSMLRAVGVSAQLYNTPGHMKVLVHLLDASYLVEPQTGSMVMVAVL